MRVMREVYDPRIMDLGLYRSRTINGVVGANADRDRLAYTYIKPRPYTGYGRMVYIPKPSRKPAVMQGNKGIKRLSLGIGCLDILER